ncbi:creatininase, partial [Arthrobacter sulfonylureivorans]
MTIATSSANSVSELKRLKVLHNGEKQQLTFSDAEFERRLTGLRAIMAAKE